MGQTSHRNHFNEKVTTMKSIAVSALVLSLSLSALVGCSQTETAKVEKKVTTPGGSTTTTVEKEVKKTGDHKD